MIGSDTDHWRKSGGGGGGDGGIHPPPPLFWVGGWPVQISPPPPLFEDKITLNMTFIVKKLTFLTVKLYQILQIIKQTLCNSMAIGKV